MGNVDDIEEDVTVQEAVMVRYERIVDAIAELSEDLIPKAGEDFKIKAVVTNLQVLHKVSGEMLKILVAAVIEDQEGEDSG